nr:hypothetical protein [Tanacetum cinerariifolium]
MNGVVKVAVQIQFDRLRDEAQAKNEEFLNKLDENIQTIIKEQVKEQVKVQVFKILSKIEKTMNEQLEAKVLTRSSNSSKTSYTVAADLSEMELKKIIIEKIESNKFIHRLDEQRNLYKALIDAYKCDKIILDTYGDTVTLKRLASLFFWSWQLSSLAVGTSSASGNSITGSGNALCILFPTEMAKCYVVMCLLVSVIKCSQEHLEDRALDPRILAMEKREQRSKGSTCNGIYSFLYNDINLQRPRSRLFDLTKGGKAKH